MLTQHGRELPQPDLAVLPLTEQDVSRTQLPAALTLLTCGLITSLCRSRLSSRAVLMPHRKTYGTSHDEHHRAARFGKIHTVS